MAKLIIYVGLLLVFVGLIIHFFGDKVSWFGNLYGDIKINKPNYKFYFPMMSMLIVSIVLTLLINFFSRFFK